jgi:hypothetical protein
MPLLFPILGPLVPTNEHGWFLLLSINLSENCLLHMSFFGLYAFLGFLFLFITTTASILETLTKSLLFGFSYTYYQISPCRYNAFCELNIMLSVNCLR